jgi:ProP effector
MPKTPDPKGKPPTTRGCEGFSGVVNSYGGDLKPSVDSSPIRQFARRATAVIARLAELFPACFFVNQRQRRPLKVDIHLDILAATTTFSPDELGDGLKFYVNAFGYLRAVKAGAERIDLDGNAAGSVTATNEAHAKQRAEKMAKRSEKLRKARAEAKVNKAKPKPEPTAGPTRLSLADLREAAHLRKQSGGGS